MKIAIAGYGVEGEANYRYWSQDPNNQLTIVDEHTHPKHPLPEGVEAMLGEGALGKLDGFDMVIRTAGLSPYKIKTTGKVWSGTNEFFVQCPAPIIGVTGSKGKGTTSSLIASILEAAGKKVWLVGNIGKAAIEVVDQIQPDDIVVYELSSFQLWDIERSPHVAVVLFIEQEHLDVHPNMDDYVEAKGNIARYQTAHDVVIFNQYNQYATHIADQSAAQRIGYPDVHYAHVDKGYFWYGDQKLCSVDVLQIKGEHNVVNAIAAINAVWLYTQQTPAIEEGLRAFKGLPHRLAYVRTVNGVDYYDDSIATTPASAIAALRAFSDKKKVIILGGSSKGSDFAPLAHEMLHHDVQAILIGDEAENIASALKAVGFDHYEFLQDATGESIVAKASEIAEPDSVVLLSPSSASFGLFKNYVDRGEQFIAAVKAL